jgi:hypothetical protein
MLKRLFITKDVVTRFTNNITEDVIETVYIQLPNTPIQRMASWHSEATGLSILNSN